MIHWKRAARFGFAAWLVPFLVSLSLFPLRKLNAPLFETLMSLTVVSAAGALFTVYCRGRIVRPREMAATGMLWAAINLVMDYPLFAYGPMKMAAGAYYSGIGLDYLTFPVFAVFAALVARRQALHDLRAR